MAAFFGGGARAGAGEVGQAIEIGLVEDQRVISLVGEHVLAERGAEARQPLVDGGELILYRFVERAARAHEAGVIAIEHAGLLRRQAEAVAPGVEIGDAGIEGAVQIERVVVAGEQRRDVALDLFDGVAGVGAGLDEEDRCHAVERAAAALQGFNGIGEAGRRRVGGDRVDLGAMALKRGVEGRAELVGLERAERRQPERAGPVGEQGIVGSRGRGLGSVHGG